MHRIKCRLQCGGCFGGESSGIESERSDVVGEGWHDGDISWLVLCDEQRVDIRVAGLGNDCNVLE